MDRGQLTFLQTKIGERTYLLFCDPMSPIPEIRQALVYFSEELEKIETEQLQSQYNKEAEIIIPEAVDG